MHLRSADAALLVAGVLLLALWLKNSRHLSKPPGPPGLPFLGNIFGVPTGKRWEGFSLMSKRYGPLVSVSIGSLTMVVANTFAIAHDVLNKKSHIYSDRPRIPLAEMVGWNITTGLLTYGPKLKRTRQMFHAELGTRALVEGFHEQIDSQARTFLTLLRDDPEKLKEHCYYHAGAFILRITYGYTASVSNDKFLTKSEHAMGQLNESLSSGRYLVNIFPFLRHLPDWAPGTTFKRDAKRYHQSLVDMINSPVKWVQEKMKSETTEEFARPSKAGWFWGEGLWSRARHDQVERLRVVSIA